MDRETFDKFNSRYQKEKAKIEENLDDSSLTISNISEYIQEAVDFSSKLNTVWSSGTITVKENMQKLIYPEGIYYERKKDAFRTDKKNFIFTLIEANSDSSGGNKKGKNSLIAVFPLQR